MPIYEFYCSDCHRIFNFLARHPDSSKRPDCPRCGRRRLERRASLFAIAKGRPEPAGEGELPDLDEGRMERAMAEMAREAEGLDEGDPRQMARLMRRMFASTGMPLGEGMEEAIRRMEAGEDPDKVEDELGDLLEGEEGQIPAPGGRAGLSRWRRRLLPPSVDAELHEL